MTKIKNTIAYVPDDEINGLDYLIGTDYDKSLKTSNFRIKDIVNYINSFNGNQAFDFLFYIKPTSPDLKPADGYFYSKNNVTLVEDITELYFSKFNQQGKNVSQFFLGIVNDNPFNLKIAQLGGINKAYYFRINEVIDNSNYYTLKVTKIFSTINSELQEGLAISIFELKSSGGSIVLNTSDLNNDGADGTSTYVETDELGAVAFSNDYNDLDNLPTLTSNKTNIVLGEDIGNNKVVSLNVDGKYYLANRTNELSIKSNLLYVELGGLMNQTIMATINGFVNSDAITVGERYYVGTFGTITNTPSNITGEFDRYIGTSTETNKIYFEVDAEYYEIGDPINEIHVHVIGSYVLGIIDGVNNLFTIDDIIITNSEELFCNGIRMKKPNDYNISGSNLTLNFSPLTTEILTINYLK